MDYPFDRRSDTLKWTWISVQLISRGLPARLAPPRAAYGAAERARRAGVADIKTLSTYGDPAKAIVAFAEKEQVDLIVIGRRGLGGLSSWLLGSVSKSIIDQARCAVTVVP